MRISKISVALMLALMSASALAEAKKDPLVEALTELTSTLATYVAVLAGTSALVVALLEAYKKLFSIRGKFHRTAVIRWFSEDKASIPQKLQFASHGMFSFLALGGGGHYDVPAARKAATLNAAYSPETAYAEFFHLTSGQAQPAQLNPSKAVMQWRGVDRAVFELETSRMMSQMQDAADAVLNNPTLYPHLYIFLTRGSVGPGNTDANDWKDYLANPAAFAVTYPAKKAPDIFARVRMLTRRQLDAFQTVTTCRWGDLNQWWAMLLGALVLFIALVMAAGGSPDLAAAAKLADEKTAFDPWKAWLSGWNVLGTNKLPFQAVFFKALLGGALAPIAKDLLNSISSIKFTK